MRIHGIYEGEAYEARGYLCKEEDSFHSMTVHVSSGDGKGREGEGSEGKRGRGPAG